MKKQVLQSLSVIVIVFFNCNFFGNVSYICVIHYNIVYNEIINLFRNDKMVMKKDMGSSTWTGGCEMCKQLRLGGFSDWRLPSQGELPSCIMNVIT